MKREKKNILCIAPREMTGLCTLAFMTGRKEVEEL